LSRYVGKMKPETLFKLKVARALDSLPNTWAKKIQMVALRGIPDFLCCINGLFVAIELKPDAKTKLEPLQEYNLNAIDKAGGLAFKATPENWQKVYATLMELATGSFKNSKPILKNKPNHI